MSRRFFLVVPLIFLTIIVVSFLQAPFGGSGGTSVYAVDNMWIGLDKLYINNYVPGDSVVQTLRLRSGNSQASEFTVNYRFPDSTLEGYSSPNSEAINWVSIEPNRLIIDPYGFGEVAVNFTMPKEAVAPSDKWEFWVGVIDFGRPSGVLVELNCRWLVSMYRG